MNNGRILLSLGITLACSTVANAQAGGAIVQWVNKKIGEISRNQNNRTAAAVEAGSSKSRATTPSIDPNSPAIVDRSDPTEFFDVALALASNRGVADSSTPTGTVTTTLYALIAGLQRKSLIDPDYYRQQHYLRRVSLTVGTAASDLTKDGTTTNAAVFGGTIRFLDSTDVFAHGNPAIENIRNKLRDSTAEESLNVRLRQLYQHHHPSATLEDVINAFSTVESIDDLFNSLTTEERKDVHDRLQVIAQQYDNVETLVTALRNYLEKPRILSLAYFTNQRHDNGADDHRAELIFDYGYSKRLNWTINAGLEYRNVYKHTGGDQKGGRFATEAQYKLYNLSNTTDTVERWITSDFGFEWKAMTGTKPSYTGQAQITIPLIDGVSLPIVWRYMSQLETPTGNGMNNQPQKKFTFGLAFDPGKLTALAK